MTEGNINRTTLADQVFAQVVTAIVVRDIATGTPISENEVALRFGVSRRPAGEALVRLDHKQGRA
jgi:DNA-binding GntR family transcriptional regulator